jgi:DNA-binding SARP family transcriptional activator
MSALRVRLFGKLAIEREGRELVGLEACKAQELLCYLLVNRRPHAREALACLLWEDAPAEKAKKYLRQALWQLQAVLDPADGDRPATLRAEHDWVQIDPTTDLWLDVEIFERAFASTEGHAGALTDAQRDELAAAVALYRGDLLEGCYRDWCLYERERLQNAYLLMLDRLLSHCEAGGDYEAGRRYGALILRHDRARERTHRRLMRLHYAAGERTEALRQYERCAAALGEELGVAPDRRTSALYRRIRNDEPLTNEAQPDALTGAANGDGGALSEVLGRLRRLQQTVADVHHSLQREITVIESALRRRVGREPDGRG